jgi:predicted nucleic acid-binding protein
VTLYDSSVLIGYLDGDEGAVEYVETHLDERAVAPPLVLFEVYQGEVFKTGPADFDAVDRALGWLTIVDETASLSRAAGELQNELRKRGTPLAARDAFIAGVAMGLDERLAVADSDFDVDGITDVLDVDFV